MRSFKDGAGRTWDVELDAWLIKQVASRTGVQLGKLLDDKMALWGELTADPVKFVDVLFVLVADRAEKTGVTEEQFFRGLTGDALEAAYEAFRGAFEDFSPRHLRAVLRAAAEGTKVAQEKVTQRALTKIAKAVEKATTEPTEPEPTPEGAAATSSTSVSAPPGSPASAPAG